jgi:purine-binding chemotaxis protein CheW
LTIAIIVHLLKYRVIWLELPPRGHRDAFSASMTPRTLNQLVAFTLNRQPYALRLASVRQVLRTVEVTPLPKAPEIVLGVVSLGGAVIPVLSIRRRLGLTEREASLSDQLIVADSGCRTIALLVDAVIGVVERSTEEITDAERIVPGAQYVEGIAKLDNDMLFIHNLDLFLSQPEESQLHDALAKRQGAE